MGPIAIPTAGLVYLDAQILIYSVERHPRYALPLQPPWDAVQQKRAAVVTSELSILECFVGPLRDNNTSLVDRFDVLFASPALELEEVSEDVLRYAAGLRAQTPSLRGPDAIHAATAFLRRASSFLTNDRIFKRLGLIGLIQLDEMFPASP